MYPKIVKVISEWKRRDRTNPPARGKRRVMAIIAYSNGEHVTRHIDIV